MIRKEQLNDDQLKSFNQMTQEGGLIEDEALAQIEKWCIQGGYTGLRATKFGLTPEAQAIAKELAEGKKGVGRQWIQRFQGMVVGLCKRLRNHCLSE